MGKLLYRYDVKLKDKKTGEVYQKTFNFVAPSMKAIRNLLKGNTYNAIHSITKVSRHGF